MPAPDVPSSESTDPPSSRSDPPSSTTSPAPAAAPYQTAWPWVLCVIGLDYLSTLAYQPSIAFNAAGRLAPLVTVLIVVATLFLAMPLYWYIAGRSPHGGGSTALLEHLIPGWFGKLLVLVLLAFGAVDLVFTRTFSATNAAEHMIHCPNPDWQAALGSMSAGGDGLLRSLPPVVQQQTEGVWNRHTVVTLLVLLIGTVAGLVFFKGYTRGFVRLAIGTVGLYLLLTLTVIGSGVAYLMSHPEVLERWWAEVCSGNWRAECRDAPGAPLGWGGLLAACVPLFPYLALGLSGFELTLMAMPLVRGKPDDNPERPKGKIRNTRVVLTIAALTMSAYLLASTLVTTVLIPPAAHSTEGQAKYRALSYLAHGGAITHGQTAAAMNPLFGLAFGTLYDFSTVAILALAGLSFAMTLAAWIPPYLQRLGMEFDWSVRLSVLVYIFTGVKFAVTIYYAADVEAHRAAYLTGVLAVFAFAALGAALDVWHKRRRLRWRKAFRIPPLFLLGLVVFASSGLLVAHDRPVGAKIAGAFVVVVLIVSVASRAVRCTELRFTGFDFADKATHYEWERLRDSDFSHLVPLRPGGESLKEKEIAIRTRHRIPGTVPIVFVQAELADPSDFSHRPRVRIQRENGRVVIYITRCVSIPHAIAAAALDLASAGSVPEVHFGWSVENPVTANLHFVLFGHGNVPWMVHTLIRRAVVPDDRKPRVIVG